MTRYEGHCWARRTTLNILKSIRPIFKHRRKYIDYVLRINDKSQMGWSASEAVNGPGAMRMQLIVRRAGELSWKEIA